MAELLLLQRLDIRTRPPSRQLLRRLATVPAAAARYPQRTFAGEISLRDRMTPVRYQGGLGTCASFGVVACLEYFCQQDLSEACITHETETQFGDCKAGLDIGQVMVAAQSNGVVTEVYWPYDYRQICWTNPPDVSTRPRYAFNDVWLVYATQRQEIVARMRRAERPLESSCVEQIKETIDRFRVPVAVAVPVFRKSTDHLDAGWEAGDIHMPTPSAAAAWVELRKDTPDSGDDWHTIPICGYDDQTARFTFKNSWGGWWGDRGFGTISYEYIITYSSEAFAATA